MLTATDIRDAIWQAWYHGELDDFIKDAYTQSIDGNDDSSIDSAARAIYNRLNIVNLSPGG